MDGCGIGLSGETLEDFLFHYAIAHEKCLAFEGDQQLII
jgi:hypothetical protein